MRKKEARAEVLSFRVGSTERNCKMAIRTPTYLEVLEIAIGLRLVYRLNE